tara:strand:+ start:951 stop:1844 length:894 start_codon:yes stop_codon:yes gene_type:complete
MTIKNKKIFWLPAYPKSGNTWLRLILCGLFFTKDGKIKNFDILKKIPGHDRLSNFEFVKEISINDYNVIFKKSKYDESMLLAYSKYWIESQKRTKINHGSFGFFKTHNARVKINNNYYTDSVTTSGFIYISRDPRDIAISYSNHINKSISDTINILFNGQIVEREKVNDKMPEVLLNWKDHYLSWKKFSNEVPSLFIKYEDLLDDTKKEINKIINFLETNYKLTIENKTEKINNIIETTLFQNLSKIEKNQGFVEKANKSIFFRKGNKNQWMDILKKEDHTEIEQRFYTEMKNLKYI